MEIITRAEAKEKGLTRYFTGKACKHRHISERSVGRWRCIECTKGSAKEYYQENIEKLKEYQKENIDRIREYRKEYYQENSKKLKENRGV